MTARIVLASASAGRRQVLQSAGLDFEIQPADVDETALKTPEAARDPRRLSLDLARLKAQAVSHARPDDWVIGSDQVLATDRGLVSKARDIEEARARLIDLRGRAHTLHSAVCLAKAGQVLWSTHEAARMVMRDFSDAFLEDYLRREGEALLGSVGCYRIEGLGAQLFARVEGDRAVIMGLPLWPLLQALREQGALPS